MNAKLKYAAASLAVAGTAAIATVPAAAEEAAPAQAEAYGDCAIERIAGVLETARIAPAARVSVATAAIGPAPRAICEKGRDEPGWFFCQGFTLYRW